ncbi:MAG TPA: hypothetical protein VGP76_17225 [Planctomycetaceae bacterium]|jgi:hypothetical protein|nr:hypothetical protein [Planctomycetaceae bacterium]
MRRFIVFVCAIALMSAPALAEDGHVSKRSLSQMGLGGMKVVSDQEGMQVRGTSIAVTFSFSTGFPLVSINSPFDVGTHHAFSASVGISGGAIAGGFASASAH